MNQQKPSVAQACEYAALIADICKLTPFGRPDNEAELTQRVFQRLGWETTINGRGWCIRRPGDSHWQSQPRILYDFGTAVHHTIGSRFGTLEHPLEHNWYIKEMCETSESASMDFRSSKIAAWAVRLGRINANTAEATAITPAAALVAAWLRAHP